MLSQACQRCWHRKQKCDRQAPECTTCKANGVKCVPRAWGRVLDSGPDIGNSHGEIRSPIEYMKRRIEYLENEDLQAEQGAIQLVSDHVPEVQTGGQDQYQTPGSYSNVIVSDRMTNDAINEVEYLSLTAMSGGGKNNDSQWQSLTMRRIMESVAMSHGVKPESELLCTLPSAQSGISLSRLRTEIETISGKEYGFFVHTFAVHTATSLACIPESESLSIVDKALHPSLQSASTADTIAAASCILALGITMSPFHNMQIQIQQLIESARRALPNVLTTSEDMIAIRCLMLQCMLSLYYPHAGSAWHLLGLALSKAISAGFHRPSKIESEESNNAAMTFWTLYLLDRTITITMGRPFGLEEADIALELPGLPAKFSSDEGPTKSKAIFALRLHHAALLSKWRHSSALDIDVCLSSYQFWRDSYREIYEHLPQLENHETQLEDSQKLSETISRMEESQLSCRALVLLLGLAVRTLPAEHVSLVHLTRYIVAEAPQLVDNINNAINRDYFVSTFLHGYDAFAAAIMYVFSIYDPRQPSLFRLRVSQMRTVTTLIDIIQHVAQTFKPIRRFQNIVWALLDTLEAKAESVASGRLLEEISECEILIPSHVRRLLDSAAKS